MLRELITLIPTAIGIATVVAICGYDVYCLGCRVIEKCRALCNRRS